jgi:hypothetical protein
MSGQSNTKAQELFWSIAEELMAENPVIVEGRIMSGRCLRVGDEFLALADYKDAGLVVKLSVERVQELIASGVGQPFAPAKRVFKEWVSVPKLDRRRWRSLLKEGVAMRLAEMGAT